MDTHWFVLVFLTTKTLKYYAISRPGLKDRVPRGPVADRPAIMQLGPFTDVVAFSIRDTLNGLLALATPLQAPQKTAPDPGHEHIQTIRGTVLEHEYHPTERIFKFLLVEKMSGWPQFTRCQAYNNLAASCAAHLTRESNVTVRGEMRVLEDGKTLQVTSITFDEVNVDDRGSSAFAQELLQRR